MMDDVAMLVLWALLAWLAVSVLVAATMGLLLARRQHGGLSPRHGRREGAFGAGGDRVDAV